TEYHLQPENHSLALAATFPSMTRFLTILSALFIAGTSLANAKQDLTVLLLIGSDGTTEYGDAFREDAALWIEAARKADAEMKVIGIEDTGKNNDAELFKKALTEIKTGQLWVVLIGHGTFDGREAKFNVRGPDFTDDELVLWLDAYEGQLALINTAPASGSLIRKASKPDRIVITATKNESETSYTHFGRYFAKAIAGSKAADLDNDKQVSLLEAFIHASNETALFYKSEGRIATEHSLIDDNGDENGSRAEWFKGTTATRTAGKDATPDGEIAGQQVLLPNAFERRLTDEQRKKRNELELEVRALRRDRENQEEAVYYEKLEALLLQLAEIYQNVTREEPPSD
ncbi:MAG: hypothetical protein P1U86_20220, partial [Verrucomicrobiales bacterium]|nr:hypothetical protein [Verrucomicrobiales bacterium]